MMLHNIIPKSTSLFQNSKVNRSYISFYNFKVNYLILEFLKQLVDFGIPNWFRANCIIIKDLTICIVVNGEQFQSRAMTLTLIEQYPMSNSSELFSYTTICSNFKLTDPLLLRYHVQRQRNTCTSRHIDGHEYSIVVADKPQL